MNGVLVIDKPAGPTSHDVVARVRKAIHERKIGHTGTLDPAATGVLPLVIGRATKVAQYLTGSKKSYRATIKLGVTTSTLDAEGEVLAEQEVGADIDEARVRKVLEGFVGDIKQVPPMYSAKKIDGQRLYKLARKGVEVAREPKQVHIGDLTMLSCDLPEVVVDVTCSAGTYVRVLAQDVGEVLGCGAHLSALRRTAAGPFTVEDAVNLEALEDAPELAEKNLVTLERALSGMPRLDVPAGVAKMIASGYQLSVADLRGLDMPDVAKGTVVTVGIENGALVAVATLLVEESDLMKLRRDERGTKTERVLQR